jgi:hypothetical protein
MGLGRTGDPPHHLPALQRRPALCGGQAGLDRQPQRGGLLLEPLRQRRRAGPLVLPEVPRRQPDPVCRDQKDRLQVAGGVLDHHEGRVRRALQGAVPRKGIARPVRGGPVALDFGRRHHAADPVDRRRVRDGGAQLRRGHAYVALSHYCVGTVPFGRRPLTIVFLSLLQ